MAAKRSWFRAEREPGAASKRNSLYKVIVLFLSIGLAIAIAEAFLRSIGFSYLLYPESIQFGYPDPITLKQVFLPDPDLIWIRRDYAARLKQAQSKTPNVVFMGCSCTALGRYPEMLMERIRREYPNRDWTYFNAATEGWSSYQGVRQLERDILNLKPKIITIYFGWNDHWIHFGIEDKEVLAIHSSWLFKLQELRIAQLLMRAWVAAEGRKTNRSQLRVSESDFRKNLTAMVDLARSQGITPILLTAPTSHQQGQEPVHLQGRWIANLADLIPVHQLYVSIVREVAQEKNVALCDLEKSFKVLLDKDQLRECFSSDGIHLRLEGDRIIAELLYDLLLAKKLIESP